MNKLDLPPPPPPELILKPSKRTSFFSSVRYHSSTIYACSLFILILVGSIYHYNTIDEMSSYCRALTNYGDSIKLYSALHNSTITNNAKTVGLYSPSTDVYCIWNRSKRSNEKTESHEYCHYLIDEGTCFNDEEKEITCAEHYCDGYWEG